MPFVRTYITVVAGVTEMERRRFFFWSAVGAAIWVISITLLGFFLGRQFPGLGENIDKAISLQKKPAYLMTRARLLREAARIADARAQLLDLITQYPTSREAVQARTDLGELGGQ